jgi:hypothetical protein
MLKSFSIEETFFLRLDGASNTKCEIVYFRKGKAEAKIKHAKIKEDRESAIRSP